jgi:chromosomal replication initiation ATPase DnaA
MILGKRNISLYEIEITTNDSKKVYKIKAHNLKDAIEHLTNNKYEQMKKYIHKDVFYIENINVISKVKIN